MFPTFLSAVIAVSTCLGLLFVLVMEIRARRKPVYEKRGPLLSSAEYAFFRILERALADDYRIMAKVRLADLVVPHDDLGVHAWRKAFHQVSCKHADFVLCRPETMAPVCVIELDDASHGKQSRGERDRFVDSVFHSAGLAVVHCRVRRTYSPSEIRSTVRRAMNPPQPERPGSGARAKLERHAPVKHVKTR